MVKYDIIYVDFPHREHDGTSSRHPAVVLDSNKIAVLGAQVTSKVDKYNDNTDYKLEDWEEENLDRPSVVRLGQQEAFTEDNVIIIIGHLTDKDITGIESILAESLNEALEEGLDRNTLITLIKGKGFNYKFDKYDDQQLFRMYQRILDAQRTGSYEDEPVADKFDYPHTIINDPKYNFDDPDREDDYEVE